MITLRTLSLQRGVKPLLNDVNLTLYAGQKIGFIGANGSGKSSLFALLLGELHQDAGDIDLPPKLTIAHVAQETPAVAIPAIEYVLDGDQELRDITTQLAMFSSPESVKTFPEPVEGNSIEKNGMREATLHAQFDAIGGYTARTRAAQLLYGLGFAAHEVEKPVNEFSGGWRMRLNLARALMCRSDLLLLDEPTNHLDLDAVLWFEQWLSRYRGTLLLISHDRDFLDSVVDTIAHLYNQKITLYSGNYEAFEKQRIAQLALQQAAYQKQQQQISHIHAYIERFRYKASKAKQAQSRLKALGRMEMIAAAHVDSPFQFEFQPPPTTPALLVNLEKISVGYAEKPILEQVTLQITAGSRLGLLGANGAGKSTLIKLLAGLLQPLAGHSHLGNGLRIGYFAQHQVEQLHNENSPLQHLQRLDNTATDQVLRNFLGGFGFVGDMALAAVAPFSGGERARLALALLVWQRPNLLLLDEPTNHLDLDMRHALTLALQDYTGALVIVSHDRYLLRTTTDQLLLVANQRVKPFNGDLTDYRNWLFEQRTESTTVKNNSTQAKISVVEKKRLDAENREQRRPLQNRLKQLEKTLDQLAQEKMIIENLLADPAIYTDKTKVHDYIRQQALLSEKLQQTETAWLEVTETLENLQNTRCNTVV